MRLRNMFALRMSTNAHLDGYLSASRLMNISDEGVEIGTINYFDIYVYFP